MESWRCLSREEHDAAPLHRDAAQPRQAARNVKPQVERDEGLERSRFTEQQVLPLDLQVAGHDGVGRGRSDGVTKVRPWANGAHLEGAVRRIESGEEPLQNADLEMHVGREPPEQLGAHDLLLQRIAHSREMLTDRREARLERPRCDGRWDERVRQRLEVALRFRLAFRCGVEVVRRRDVP